MRCEITAPFMYQLSDVDVLFYKQLYYSCGNIVLLILIYDGDSVMKFFGIRRVFSTEN